MLPVPPNMGDLTRLDPAPIQLDECPPFHHTFRKRPKAIIRQKSIGASMGRPPPYSLGPVSCGEVATEVQRVGDFDSMFEPYILIKQVAEFTFFGGGEVPVDVVLSVEEVRNLQLGIWARCRQRGRWLGQGIRFVDVHAYCGWVVWSGGCGVGSSIVCWSGVSTGKGHVHIDTRNSGLWLGLRLGPGLSVRVVKMRGVVTHGGGRVVTIGGFCDGPFEAGVLEPRVMMVDVRSRLVGMWSESTSEPELLLSEISISMSSSSSEISSMSTQACFLYLPGCLEVGIAVGRMAEGGGMGKVGVVIVSEADLTISLRSPSGLSVCAVFVSL